MINDTIPMDMEYNLPFEDVLQSLRGNNLPGYDILVRAKVENIIGDLDQAVVAGVTELIHIDKLVHRIMGRYVSNLSLSEVNVLKILIKSIGKQYGIKVSKSQEFLYKD
jgi:hypothetical protein